MDLLQGAVPWRVFRWYHGQQHYSGTYWSSTQHDHVIYESRLELARLLFADFDPAVRWVVAQPFLLSAEAEGVKRRHVPDFLLGTRSVPVVVDVKLRRRLDRPEVASTLAWTRSVVQSRGWTYEVWSEPDATVLGNLRFLAGYRRSWLFDAKLLDEVRAAELPGCTLADAFAALPGRRRELVKAAVLHLVWAGEFALDIKRPLSGRHVLQVSP